MKVEHDKIFEVYTQCAWCDFESALFSFETLNRISHGPGWKVKHLHVETVECIVPRRVSHGQPFAIAKVPCIVLRGLAQASAELVSYCVRC